MRYRLRTLLIVLAVLPALLGFLYWFVILENWNPTAVNDRMFQRQEERERRAFEEGRHPVQQRRSR